MKSGFLGADGVCMAFLKQIAGGDVMAEDTWLAECSVHPDGAERLGVEEQHPHCRGPWTTSGPPAPHPAEGGRFLHLNASEGVMEYLMIGWNLLGLLWKDIFHNPQG